MDGWKSLLWAMMVRCGIAGKQHRTTAGQPGSRRALRVVGWLAHRHWPRMPMGDSNSMLAEAMARCGISGRRHRTTAGQPGSRRALRAVASLALRWATKSLFGGL